MEIVIEPLDWIDLAQFNSLRNRCALGGYLHNQERFSYEQAVDWFKNLPEHKKYYSIYLRRPMGSSTSSTNTYMTSWIGYFRTRLIDSRIMEIGADITEISRGNGLGELAYRTFFKSEYAKGIKDFRLEVLGDNIRAYNLYRKLGFHLAGVTEIERDGRKIPSIQMSWSLF